MADWRQETVDTYNKHAKEFAVYFQGIGSRVKDIEKTFELAGNPKNAKVVEIGCANGRDAKEITKRTKNYIGFDIAEEFIKLARTNLPGVSFEVGDAVIYNYPQNLDIVFAFASLLHLDKEEIKQVLQKVHASLKLGGIFFISLKRAPEYREYVKETKQGRRMFYYYNAAIITELAGKDYEVVYKQESQLDETDWLELALKKL